jgi:hypothetical protein
MKIQTRSLKRRFELMLHGEKFQKSSLIGTAVNASPKRVSFEHWLYASLEILCNTVSTVTQLWKSANLRNPEGGDDEFSETSVQTRITRHKVWEGIFNGYRSENIPDDRLRLAFIVSLYGGLISSISKVIQMWKPTTLRNPEHGDYTFSLWAVRNSATR